MSFLFLLLWTHLFSSSSSLSSLMPTLLLRLRLAARRRRARLRASGPVVKSARRRWTKNRPPANGQIESEVVALVSVPSTGERRERRSGGRRSGRSADEAGRRAVVSKRLAVTYDRGLADYFPSLFSITHTLSIR